MVKGIFLSAFLILGVATLGFADIQQSLNEANDKFYYQNKPIHPALVQQFLPSIADPGEPTTISVDIAAQHPNQYDDDEVTVNYANICTKPDKDGGTFCYQHLGKLANGLHVLSTADSGGGSGVFENLIFVRFGIDQGINENGKAYSRLLMMVFREYPLGDRDSRQIKVLPDKVIIGTEKQTVLSF